jgi:hypothetical protein
MYAVDRESDFSIAIFENIIVVAGREMYWVGINV